MDPSRQTSTNVVVPNSPEAAPSTTSDSSAAGFKSAAEHHSISPVSTSLSSTSSYLSSDQPRQASGNSPENTSRLKNIDGVSAATAHDRGNESESAPFHIQSHPKALFSHFMWTNSFPNKETPSPAMAMDRNPFQSVNERRAKLTGAATGAGACAGQAQSLNQLRQAQQQQNPPAVAGRSLISSNWRTDAGPKTMVYGVGDDNDVVTPMGNGINSVGGFDPMPASLHQNRHHQDGHQRPLQIIASPAQLRLQQVLPTIVSSTSMVAPPTTLTSSASMTTLPFSLVHESLSGHQHHHHQQSSSSPTTLERLQHQLQRQQIAEAATSSTTAATLQGAMISVPLQYQEQFQASQQQQTHVAAAVRGSSSSTSSAGSVGSTHAGRHQMQLQQQQAGQMQVRTQEAADSTTGGGGVGASNHIKLAYASTSAMSTLKPDTGAPVSGAINSVPQAPGLTAGVGSQIFAAGAVSAATTAVVASGPDVVVLTIPVQAWNAATAYCLDRGDGFVTRLVPVDMLPVKLRDVPVRESLASSSTTLVVLPCPPMARACGSNEGYCGEVRAVGPAYLGERLLEMTPAVGILNSSGGGVLLGSVHGPAAGGVGGGAAAIAGSRTASSDDRGNLSVSWTISIHDEKAYVRK